MSPFSCDVVYSSRGSHNSCTNTAWSRVQSCPGRDVNSFSGLELRTQPFRPRCETSCSGHEKTCVCWSHTSVEMEVFGRFLCKIGRVRTLSYTTMLQRKCVHEKRAHFISKRDSPQSGMSDRSDTCNNSPRGMNIPVCNKQRDKHRNLFTFVIKKPLCGCQIFHHPQPKRGPHLFTFERGRCLVSTCELRRFRLAPRRLRLSLYRSGTTTSHLPEHFIGRD